MTLWSDCEEMCNTIRRNPEAVDLGEVLALLRRSQEYMGRVHSSLLDATVYLPGETLSRLVQVD